MNWVQKWIGKGEMKAKRLPVQAPPIPGPGEAALPLQHPPLDPEGNCGYCGKPVEPYDNFCRECGHLLRGVTAHEQPRDPYPSLEDLEAAYHRPFYRKDGFVRDSLWDSPDYRRIEEKVDRLVDQELRRMGVRKYQLGNCHIAWGIKKRIFREQYGIEWLTPTELNPGILFD